MASAISRPSFTFNLSTTTTSKLNPHHTFSLQFPKSHNFLPIQNHPRSHIKSTDISKEDKPISPPEESRIELLVEEQEQEQEQEEGEGEKFDNKKRVEEKFAVLNTGIYECRSCGYKYDESVGDSSYPIPPGLPFNKLPDDWRCATCGASKTFFESKSVEIAGFAENQQFGLGGNALTSGQKSLLIWGSLGLGFLFFLSGYFLQ